MAAEVCWLFMQQLFLLSGKTHFFVRLCVVLIAEILNGGSLKF